MFPAHELGTRAGRSGRRRRSPSERLILGEPRTIARAQKLAEPELNRSRAWLPGRRDQKLERPRSHRTIGRSALPQLVDEFLIGCPRTSDATRRRVALRKSKSKLRPLGGRTPASGGARARIEDDLVAISESTSSEEAAGTEIGWVTAGLILNAVRPCEHRGSPRGAARWDGGFSPGDLLGSGEAGASVFAEGLDGDGNPLEGACTGPLSRGSPAGPELVERLCRARPLRGSSG